MKMLLCGVCLTVGAILILLAYSVGGGATPIPAAGVLRPLGSTASLRGTLYSEKFHRLVLDWDNGDVEWWDTERGERVGQVEHLPRQVGWCVASPDEATVLSGDRLPNTGGLADVQAQARGFLATISIWDIKSGQLKHSVRIPEAEWHRINTPDWYAHWLTETRAVVVRTWRGNPARAVHMVRLFVIDTVTGKVVQASDEIACHNEHLILSPDRTMALLKSDSRVRRAKDGSEVLSWYVYSPTDVLDLERLKVVSTLKEPSQPNSPDRGDPLDGIARWFPDGKTVLTAGADPNADVKLWDARSGRLLRTLSGHKSYILDVALTAGGDKLLTASEDHTVRVWDTQTGKSEVVFSHKAGVNKVVVLPGDKLAVSGGEEPTAKVWELATGKLKFELSDHDSAVREVEVVSDQVVRTLTRQGTSTLWDCATGKRLEVRFPAPPFPKRFGACEMTEDSGMLKLRLVRHE
jgi:WD40 repeat protein